MAIHHRYNASNNEAKDVAVVCNQCICHFIPQLEERTFSLLRSIFSNQRDSCYHKRSVFVLVNIRLFFKLPYAAKLTEMLSYYSQ